MEELKLVLESVESLGKTGAWLFVAFLGKELLGLLIKMAAVFFWGKYTLSSVKKLVESYDEY